MNQESEVIQKSYYSVIPANVRYDETLTANAKLMYGEITALSNQKGFCYASNSYFAELYKVTPQAISKWINQLANQGYVKLEFVKKDNLIQERHIYICDFQIQPKQNVKRRCKKVPLLEREPVNELEKVEKVYLTNYKELYEQGILKMEKPVINWTASRKLTNEVIRKYGIDNIISAVQISKNNQFCVDKGYSLTTILSAGVLAGLLNGGKKSYGVVNEQFRTEEINF